MPRTSDKREKLINSADALILRHGFRQTTLADIAEDSGVPLGNVYYYFKTKDDIGRTVVAKRIDDMKTLLAHYDLLENPRERLLAFLDHPLQIREQLAESGCPLGTLAYELSHTSSSLTDASKALIGIVLEWTTRQFEALGKRDGRELALQFVANLQGMSLIANALDDPHAVDSVVRRTRDWIHSL